MNEWQVSLVQKLLPMNEGMTEERAQTWVELLWSDYEATSARAGHDYKGGEHTARLVHQLLTSYGDKLHLFASKNPKYAELLS